MRHFFFLVPPATNINKTSQFPSGTYRSLQRFFVLYARYLFSKMYLNFQWYLSTCQNWTVQKLDTVSPHGIPFQKLQVLIGLINIQENNIQLTLGMLLNKKKMRLIIFSKTRHIECIITLFRNPSRISLTCSRRNFPTIKINGIWPFPTCPPPSWLFTQKHSLCEPCFTLGILNMKKLHTIPFPQRCQDIGDKTRQEDQRHYDDKHHHNSSSLSERSHI